MGTLPNATYLGFTGTPIDKTSYGQSTFITFGKDDPPYGYIDKYGIVESIDDGTTIPLHYTLAPNDLLVDRDTLDKEFLLLAESEGVSDFEELNKVLERAVNLKNMLKNEDRVKLVAKYVADHYRDYIEPMGYKAFLVAVDRTACAMYKDELDKHLPPEYSRVVYSTSHDDHGSLLTRYYLSDDEEKRVRKDFIDSDKLPKILIVTEKLLTGFDAPVLYCMYLDKPMRDHVLLQAIARVNRPYEDANNKAKPCGFILDFVGIFSNLEKALAFDSHDIAGVVRDISILKDRFAHLIEEARASYLMLVDSISEDKAVEAVLNHFIDKDIRDSFYKFFREISEIYEILSPDAFLAQYINDMETLTRMYRIVREAYDPPPFIDREFSRKTAQLVQKHTSTSNIKSAIDVYEIDGDTIRKIEESNASTTEKVFNLLKSISVAVDNAYKELYLISIGEKAEIIAELFKDRQMTTLQALEELKNIINDINKARNERAARDVPDEVFAIYWVMKHENIANPESKANYMGTILNKYPHWKNSENHERGVKQELFKVLVQSGIQDTNRINKLAQSIMRVIKGVVR